MPKNFKYRHLKNPDICFYTINMKTTPINHRILNNISFQATPGKNLIKKVTKEFNGSVDKTDKFITLFEKAFKTNLDSNTIVDINKHYNYILSNTNFPNIKYCIPSYPSSNQLTAQRVLNECSKTFTHGELSLFRNIISKSYQKTKSLNVIRTQAQNTKINDRFFSQLALAEKIISKNSDSKLSNIEFDSMEMEESAQTIKEIANKIFS